MQSDDGTTIRLITLPDRLEPLSTTVVTQTVNNTVFVPPVPDLTARQFLSALVLNNIITEQEAVNRTTVPASINVVFNTLPATEATVARITWANMTVVPRANPLVDVLGASLNMTPSQIDNFFRQAALI
ncbi:MAG: hypothetical protein ACKO37_05475 [Vampirovibrionales bacterium]